MAYVSVDIDMADIDTQDLCDELLKRLSRKKVKDKDKKALAEAMQCLSLELGVISYDIPNKCLEDRLKLEFLSNNWEKFTSWQLEAKLL